jgi:hypothetical protein
VSFTGCRVIPQRNQVLVEVRAHLPVYFDRAGTAAVDQDAASVTFLGTEPIHAVDAGRHGGHRDDRRSVRDAHTVAGVA